MKTHFWKLVRFTFMLCLAASDPSLTLHGQSVIQFSATTYNVTEGTPEVTVILQRATDLDTVVSVDYNSTSVTATPGLDYTSVAGTLQFTAGVTNQSFTVPILNDGAIEALETFSVTLSNPSIGAVLGNRTNATVRITDNDQAIRLDSTTYPANEEDGSVQVGIVRGDDGDYPITVDLATSDGTAIAGVDYIGVTNTIELAAGKALRLVSISILNDAVPESSKTFRVSLSNPTGGGRLGSPVLASVNISDKDEAVQLEFSAYYADEGSELVRIGVLRGETESGATVDYWTSDSSATAGLDYVGVTNTLVFAAGERKKLIDVVLLDDGLKEGREVFRCTLSNPTGGARLLGSTVATIVLFDNDPGVQFTQNQVYAREDQGNVVLTVARGNSQLLNAFTVDYATANGTATAGSDYSETRGTLAFATGEMTKTVSVPVLHDDAAEKDEQFQVQLSNPTGGMLLGAATNATARVTVCDLTEMLPHRIDSLKLSAEGTVSLALSGGYTPGVGLVNRFAPFLEIIPLEVSMNLQDWSVLKWLVRTNVSTDPLTYTDRSSNSGSQRFYRVPTRSFLTPNLEPTGPYAVGRLDRWLTDPSRLNRFLISTNSSFQVAIWYPATLQAGCWPNPIADEPVLSDSYLQDNWADRNPYFTEQAARGLPLAPSSDRYPVVLLSSGHNGLRDDLGERAAQLASHGYVVMSPEHCDAWAVVLPDGSYSGTFEGKVMTELFFRNRARDLSFLADQIEQWNVSDPFFGSRLDLSRLGALGFSWGGNTVAEFARADARCRAVAPLDRGGASTPELDSVGTRKPSLFINNSSNGDTALYDMLEINAILFQVSNTEHGDIGGWGYYPTGTKARAELGRGASWTINAYVLWFFNKYLMGSTDPMPALKDYPRIINLKQK